MKNPTFHDDMKHIDIKYHFIRRVVEEGRILLEKIDIDENTTDMLTKLVRIENFEWCKTSLGLLKKGNIGQRHVSGKYCQGTSSILTSSGRMLGGEVNI